METDLSIVKVPRSRFGPVVDTSDQFKNWLTHPVKIAHLNWVATATGETKVTGDLISFWKAAAPAAYLNKIQSLWYFKGTIRIRVVVQGAAQAYGQLAIVFAPRVVPVMMFTAGTTTAYNDDTVGANVKVLPHIIVDPSKNDTYEIDLPVCTPTGWYQLGGSMDHGSWNMKYFYVNKLRYGTANAPVNGINVCVYMSIIDPVFEGMSTALSGMEQEMKMSDIIGTISNVSGLMAPAAGEFAEGVTVFSQASGAFAKVLRWFGFAKPVQGNFEAVAVTRTCDNYSHVEGNSTSIVLGCSQEQSLSIAPKYGSSHLNDMSLPHIMSLWGLASNDSVLDTTYAAEAFIFSIPVSPQLSYNGAKQDTPLSGVTNMAASWCGDVDFRFEFIASAFTRGTFLIAWDPYLYTNTAPAFADALTRLKNVTVQVVGNTAIDITIPYKNYMPALSTTATRLTAGSGRGAETYTNGTIYVYCVNPVVDNGGAAAIGCNVYTRSRNMALLGVQINNVQPVMFAQNTALSASEHIVEAATMEFGNKTDLSTIQYRCFGDMLKSVRDVSCRMVPVYESSTLSTGVGNAATSVGLDHCSYALACIDTHGSAGFATTTSFFSYLLGAYVGYRGGTKWSIMAGTNDNNVPNIGYVTRTLANGPTFYNAAIGLSSGFMGMTNSYAWSTTNLEVASRLDYTCPMTNNLDFLPARWSTTGGSAAIYDHTVARVGLATATAANANYNASLVQGSADDVVFCWFVGFPVRSDTYA